MQKLENRKKATPSTTTCINAFKDHLELQKLLCTSKINVILLLKHEYFVLTKIEYTEKIKVN